MVGGTVARVGWISMGLVVCALSMPVLAEDKKKPRADASVDAFFDTPKESKKATSLEDLSKAAAAVGHKEKQDALAPKGDVVDDEAPVTVHSAFAAQKMVFDKKLGCQPGGKDKKKLTFFIFDELPQAGASFDVCISISSKVGREMSMSVALIDPRNARLVKAEDVIDFRGRSGRMDHVLEFPAPLFKVAGPYFYVVELDGKEVARLPIFDVKVNPENGTPQPLTDARLPRPEVDAPLPIP